jgi:DNA-binding MarR family transcriptional regulator
MSRPIGIAESTASDEVLLYQLIGRVFHLGALTGAAAAAALQELELTEPFANVLWQLDPLGPAPSMSDLAQVRLCDPSTMTSLVRKLEARGLVERQSSLDDRRSKVVKITEAGIEVRSRLIQVMATTSPLARLTIREQERLYDLLSKAMPAQE